MANGAPQPRFKAAKFVTQEDFAEFQEAVAAFFEGLEKDLETLQRNQAVLELATLKVAQDMESLSDVMVDLGLLTDQDDEEPDTENPSEHPYEDFGDPAALEDGREEYFQEPDEEPAEPETDEDWAPSFSYEKGEHEKGEPDPDIERFENEGGAAASDTPDAWHRAERQAEIRARRKAAIERFEEANESDPIEAETDPNSIADVPEEGIVIIPGSEDPRGMEPENG